MIEEDNFVKYALVLQAKQQKQELPYPTSDLKELETNPTDCNHLVLLLCSKACLRKPHFTNLKHSINLKESRNGVETKDEVKQ